MPYEIYATAAERNRLSNKIGIFVVIAHVAVPSEVSNLEDKRLYPVGFSGPVPGLINERHRIDWHS